MVDIIFTITASGMTIFASGILLICLSVPIIWIDHKHMIIPDFLTIGLALSGAVMQLTTALENFLAVSGQSAFIFLFFSGFQRLFVYFRGYQGLGSGDVKFLAAATMWTGALAIPLILLIATTSALLFLFVTRLSRNRLELTTRIAFRPHLCLGLLIVWWSGATLIQSVSYQT